MAPLNSSDIELVRRLQELGIASPFRARKLIRNTVRALEVDLTDLVVLTEAATRRYVCTPIIAAMAGAKMVYGLTRDSFHGTVQEVKEVTTLFARLCGVAERVRVITEKGPDVVGQADIVTNLGFVRPIDQAMVAQMKPTAVVSLMCEAWEVRPGDVDLAVCKAKGISVLGTNESYPGLDVFSYTGWLCLKMLFDAQIEVCKTKIVIVSGDKFGQVIQRRLARCGASVSIVPHLRAAPQQAKLADADVLVVADYRRADLIIGPEGDLSGCDLADLAPAITVLQYAGRVDVRDLLKSAIPVYPGCEMDAHRMAMTLSGLGPRPVIELHAAGLKVGEIGCRGSKQSRRYWKLAEKLEKTKPALHIAGIPRA